MDKKLHDGLKRVLRGRGILLEEVGEVDPPGTFHIDLGPENHADVTLTDTMASWTIWRQTAGAPVQVDIGNIAIDPAEFSGKPSKLIDVIMAALGETLKRREHIVRIK
ncbi:hypothetical protein AB0G15_05265 [Streptosporangium sp. NPDC023825]|uniref:hypothetical protein n=1 Tax=Streptosporangium sp. NPDC023825 TaxID=3154909 RepID=UPI003442E376